METKINELNRVLIINKGIYTNQLRIRPNGHDSYDVQEENAWGGIEKFVGRFKTRQEAIDARNGHYSK